MRPMNNSNRISHIISPDGHNDIFETVYKLVQAFGTCGDASFGSFPLTSPLAFNTAYCATAQTRDTVVFSFVYSITF